MTKCFYIYKALGSVMVPEKFGGSQTKRYNKKKFFTWPENMKKVDKKKVITLKMTRKEA